MKNTDIFKLSLSKIDLPIFFEDDLRRVVLSSCCISFGSAATAISDLTDAQDLVITMSG